MSFSGHKCPTESCWIFRPTENGTPDGGLQMKPAPSATEAPAVEIEQFAAFAPAEDEIDIVYALHLAVDG